jgi:hypothetical protein
MIGVAGSPLRLPAFTLCSPEQRVQRPHFGELARNLGQRDL